MSSAKWTRLINRKLLRKTEKRRFEKPRSFLPTLPIQAPACLIGQTPPSSPAYDIATIQFTAARSGDIPPSNAGWKVIGVFNPAIARVHGLKFMVVRVAEQPLETRTGWTALPVWSNENGVSVEWIPNDRVQRIDARVIRLKPSGELRLTSVSHFQVLRQSTSDILGWEPMGRYFLRVATKHSALKTRE